VKRKGQHFLIDRGVIERIVGYAELSTEDRVLEIGPGTGNLTEALAAQAGTVFAIEVDPGLAAELQKMQKLQNGFKNVAVLNGDALKVELPDYNKVVSNLPYQISSKITNRLLSRPFDMAVLMYQKEFAKRMTAVPGQKEYGRMGMAVGYLCHVEILEIVSRSAFKPAPEVESAIVRLKPREHQVDAKRFIEFADALFNSRRKKLKNAMASMGVSRDSLAMMDEALLDRRPEELSPEEAAALLL
jgi:16S rRNA (adenine1518-N6/adenine1519-N6)-dimethyltransferase